MLLDLLFHHLTPFPDTTQGVSGAYARNIANKLAFERIVDAEARPARAGAATGAAPVVADANSFVTPRAIGAHTGHTFTHEVSANAFIFPASTGASVGFSPVLASGNSFLRGNAAGVRAGGGATSAYGGASAVAVISGVGVGYAGSPAWGVRNPTDEEVAVLALHAIKRARSIARMHEKVV